MDISKYVRLGLLGIMMLFYGCAAPVQQGSSDDISKEVAQEIAKTPPTNQVGERKVTRARPLSSKGDHFIIPQVEWTPSFKVKEVDIKETSTGLPELKVGADMSSEGGPVPLKEVLKKLVEIKGFSLSFASDVDQEAPVEVHIKADEDFWEALDNLLRQQDYFYRVKENTIVVGYKDTERFYIPAPFLNGNYQSSVGGDLLGSEETAQGMVRGTVSLEHDGTQLDIWHTISMNLDKILNLATTQAPLVTSRDVSRQREMQIREACRRQYPSRPAQQALCVDRALAAEGISRSSTAQQRGAATVRSTRSHEGFFYTIDKPLGIITVTAPHSMLRQVESYINTLKHELAKQVIIEAKIIEVRLERTHSLGVDWTNLLKDSRFNFNVVFGDNGAIYPTDGIKFISRVTMADKTFDLFLNALNEYGKVKVLSNPKLSLLNGQPAMLTVGESVRYIDSVESTVDSETGIITYTVDTKSILSGLGFSVVAQIADDDEVVLQLTPVTSQLQEPIEYRSFGSRGAESEVGLPRVNLREMSTMAKVKDGEFLIIGGLIDEIKGNKESKVPIIGDIPLIGNAFKNMREYTNKRELIILLRPRIVKHLASNM